MKLSAFLVKFENFSNTYRHKLSTDLAQASERLISAGFLTESDPYGNRWETQKKPRKPILYKTGNLFRSFVSAQTGTGFNVRSTVSYGIYHQTGTYKMPARKIIPSQNAGLPRMWMKEYERVFSKTATEGIK